MRERVKAPEYCCPPDAPLENYHDYLMTDVAIEKLTATAKSGKPFFMTVGYRKPHLPFVAPKKYWDVHDRSKLALPDN